MCGIVGYIGKKEAQHILVGGLRRLEYRGYDSAGIVTIGDKATLVRAKGKVVELATELTKQSVDDTVGIGHTRWATHGEPSVRNAHPHKSGDIYLVHNGIIENYKALKQELTQYTFQSDTDSEVLAALIDSLYDKETSLEAAVTQALRLVVGTYGIAVVSIREPEKIVVARKGSPLIIGVGDGETMIASDASALIGHTANAIYLNDGELAICTRDTVELRDFDAAVLTPKVEKIEADMMAIQKQGYDHFLLKEIMEQPTALRSTLKGRVIVDEHRAQLGGLNMTKAQLRKIEHVVLVGCGTASYAGMLASQYLEQLVEGLTVETQVASELRYRSFHLPKNSVAVFISQSGETADTLACLREMKRCGIPTLGIINAVGSTIAREVDGGVYIHAGPEIAVASSKAFTSQVVALTMFGMMLAEAKGTSAQILSSYANELSQLPDEIEKVLTTQREAIQKIAKAYARYDHAFYLGRDTLFPTALEGALKLKECSYIHADAYPAGELKHGALALVDDRFFEVMLLQDNWLFDKSVSNLAEINARSGHTLVITDSNKQIDAETIIRVTSKLEYMTPLVINIVQQLFAYYIAVERGTDVDKPRNLAKSVTVE